MSPQSKTKKFLILFMLISAAVIIINYNSDDGSFNVGAFHSLLKAGLRNPLFSANTQKGFLVSSYKCKIIDLDPFNREAKQFYFAEHYESCTRGKLFTYVTKEDNVATVHINTSLLSPYNLKNVQCCYSNITRDTQAKYPDDRIRISRCQDFTNSVTIHQDPVLVKCNNDEGLFYTNVHVAITMTKGIKNKIKRFEDKSPLSVLMIGIDSISRLNFIRTLPTTYKYIESNGWIPLLGYNKMGDNTFPNLMAILTGFNLSMLNQVCNPDVLGKLDTCPMIWYNYSKLGYVTAYAEDEADLNTFNYLKAGFKDPPTDYYFRPYILGAHKLRITKIDKVSYCTGPETSGERIMNLAKDFSVTFKGYPSLGLFWMNTFSHNKINSPTRMDRKIKEFLVSLAKEGVTENSIIVFFSDHGIRYGEIRFYNTGWFEERLPFMYFSFPVWFKRKYPRLINNFEENTNRLTSPYDLYMTLQHILLLEGKISEYKPSIGCPTCISLFDEIPFDRSCEEAGISIHFCTCYGYSEINLAQNVTLSAAQLVIDEIHNRVKTEPLCLPYELSRVRRAAISQGSSHNNDTYLLLLIETIPKAFFEATLIVAGDVSLGNFSLADSISRIDFYNGNDWCTTKLKNLCYCGKDM